jgi:hypothetical protein
MNATYDLKDAIIRYGMAEYHVGEGEIRIKGATAIIELNYEYAVACVCDGIELVTEQLAVRLQGSIRVTIDGHSVFITIYEYEATDL